MDLQDLENNPLQNLFSFFGLSVQSEKYTPYNKGLAWTEYARIHSTNPIISKLVGMRRSNVGANGWDIHCNLFRSESRNEAYANEIKKQLKNLRVDKMIQDVVALTAIYGNAYCIFNENDKPIIQKPELFNLYFDTINQSYRKIALRIDGRETKQFEEGADIWHLKEPNSMFKPLADSPMDACYGWILLYEHAIQANNTLVSRGFIGGLLAIFDEEMSGQLDSKPDEGKDVTMGQKILNRLMDAFGGSKNSNKMAYVAGVKQVMELGKSNRDMQLTELLEKAIDSMYHAYGFERTGNDSTYNNAATFNYIQWDVVGRHDEDSISSLINRFILPHYGIETSEDFCFRFNPPNDPDELANKTFYLTAYSALIGLNTSPEYKEQIANEFREKIGLDQLDPSLFIAPEPPALPNLPIAGKRAQSVKFFQKGVERFSQLTPTNKALESKDFLHYITDEKGNREEKGLFASFKKAITKQLEKAISDLAKLDELPKEIILPKIETFYPFKNLKKDLLKFTEPAVEELKQIEIAKENFADFVYPDYLLELVDERTRELLQGSKVYAGIDAETGSLINSILRVNIGKGVAEVVKILRFQVKDLAESRAKLIAQNEVASVVEKSREAVYLAQDYKFERFLNVEDSRVCSICTGNEDLGVQAIGSIACPAHVNCRCSKIYGMTKDDIL